LVEYFYDVFGNLTGVETPNKLIEYKVDGFNRRVSRTIRGSDVTRYIWLDQLRLAAELNGVRYFFAKDHRGSILKVVDVETGEIKQELKYSEFGEVLQNTNPGFQPFGFAGGLYDHDTKLVRFGARDYDASIGRWLSKDPIRFNGGTPNLYEYAINDPINFTDPTGYFQICSRPLNFYWVGELLYKYDPSVYSHTYIKFEDGGVSSFGPDGPIEESGNNSSCTPSLGNKNPEKRAEQEEKMKQWSDENMNNNYNLFNYNCKDFAVDLILYGN